MRKLKYEKFYAEQKKSDLINNKHQDLEKDVVKWVNKYLDKIDLVSICHYTDCLETVCSYYDDIATVNYATVYYFDK